MPVRSLALVVCLLLGCAFVWAQSRPATGPARKTVQHPKGFRFEHPADWRVESNNEFAQLLPPGLTADDQSENLRVLTEASPVTASDSRFVAELDRLGRQLPGFAKVGAAQGYQTRGGAPGIRTVWAGTNLATKQPIQIRMYATTLNGLAVVLFAAGLTTKLDAHESLLREIALSVAPSPPQQQRAAAPPTGAVAAGSVGNAPSPLAQAWVQKLAGKKLVMLSSYNSGGGGGMSSKVEMMLNRDGTFSAYSESAVSMNVPGASGSSGGTRRGKGTWRIYLQSGPQGGRPALETRYDNGQVETSALEDRNGQTFINGKRWFVTD